MKNRRLIQRMLLGVIVLALVSTAVVFIGYRRVARNPDIILDAVKKEADMRLNKLRQTAMKNGIKEWRLEAESATLVEKEQTVLLSKPDVVFFMQDGENVHLTAQKGIIYTDSNRIDVSGQVSAQTQDYQFHTEAMHYDPGKKELRADVPVALSGQSFTLNAAAMTMNLETNTTCFEGNVKGTISEDIQL